MTGPPSDRVPMKPSSPQYASRSAREPASVRAHRQLEPMSPPVSRALRWEDEQHASTDQYVSADQFVAGTRRYTGKMYGTRELNHHEVPQSVGKAVTQSVHSKRHTTSNSTYGVAESATAMANMHEVDMSDRARHIRERTVKHAAGHVENQQVTGSAVASDCTTTPRHLMVRGIDDKHTFDKFDWPQVEEVLLSQAEVTAIRAKARSKLWLDQTVKAAYLDGTPLEDDDNDVSDPEQHELHNTMQAEDYPGPPEDFLKWIRDIERLEIRAMEHFHACSGAGEKGAASGWPLSLQVYRLFADTVRATGMGTATDPGMEDFRPKETKEARASMAAAGVHDLHAQSGGDRFLTVMMVRDKFHEWEMSIDMHQATEIYCHFDVDGDGLVTPADMVAYFAGGLEVAQLEVHGHTSSGCKNTARFNPQTPHGYDEHGVQLLWHKYARLNQKRRREMRENKIWQSSGTDTSGPMSEYARGLPGGKDALHARVKAMNARETNGEDEVRIHQEVVKIVSAIQGKVVARARGEEDIKRKMINCFRKFDTNGDGSIAADELADTVFQFFLIHLNEQQSDYLFNYMDMDGSGVIDRYEFLNGVMNFPGTTLGGALGSHHVLRGGRLRFDEARIEQMDTLQQSQRRQLDHLLDRIADPEGVENDVDNSGRRGSYFNQPMVVGSGLQEVLVEDSSSNSQRVQRALGRTPMKGRNRGAKGKHKGKARGEAIQWVERLLARIRKAIVQRMSRASVKAGKSNSISGFTVESMDTVLDTLLPDGNHHGGDEMTKEMIAEGLMNLGLNSLNPLQMGELMAYFDLNGDGVVQKDEFIQVLFAGEVSTRNAPGVDAGTETDDNYKERQYAQLEEHSKDRRHSLNASDRHSPYKHASTQCAEAWEAEMKKRDSNHTIEPVRKMSIPGSSQASKITREAAATWSDSTAIAASLVGVGNGVPLSEATLASVQSGRSKSQTEACVKFKGPHASAAVDLALGLPPSDFQVYTTAAYHKWSQYNEEEQIYKWKKAAEDAPSGSVLELKAKTHVRELLQRQRRHMDHGLGMGMPPSIANGLSKPPPTTYNVKVHGHGPGGTGGNPFQDGREVSGRAGCTVRSSTPHQMPLHASHVAVRTATLDDQQIARAYSNRWAPWRNHGRCVGMAVLPEMQSGNKYDT